MDGFWLWIEFNDYKWYVVVALDEEGTTKKPYLVDSCEGFEFAEAFGIAKQIIKDVLSSFPDNPSISPDWDWEYLHEYPPLDSVYQEF